jgi:hypothetical protein
MTPFEVELNSIIQRAIRYGENGANDRKMASIGMPTQPEYDEFVETEIEAIKQAVDKHLIGEDRDWRLAATRPQMDMARSNNVLRRDMRRSLWGDKS